MVCPVPDYFYCVSHAFLVQEWEQEAYLGEDALSSAGGTSLHRVWVSGDLFLPFCDIMDDFRTEGLVCMTLGLSCWTSPDRIVVTGYLLLFFCHFGHKVGINFGRHCA